MIKDTSIEQFLDDLASKSPTPGGGSAAAIMGAMGAALVSMVCNLTIGKKNYASVEEEMTQVLVQAEGLRERLLAMVRADVEAFDQVMAAYGMPRATDEEQQARSARIQEALKVATRVPLDCAQACAEVVRLSRSVADHGNTNVISDAGVAVVAAHAALRSAALNVHVNTGAIKDEAFVASSLDRLGQIMASVDTPSQRIYDDVLAKL